MTKGLHAGFYYKPPHEDGYVPFHV